MIGKKSLKSEKLFIIDGHALSYRSFYAIRELTASNGQATNAVYGFISTLRKIIKVYDPQYLAVCFDSRGKTFRAQKFDQYKIQRPSMPENLISQMPIIKEVLEAYNIPVFESEGFEADDLIATLTKKVLQDNIEVVIVSEDKDLYQLVDKNVYFFSSRKDVILGEKDLEKSLGFPPKLIVDFIALAGDKADNIPGVLGVGDVTARKLIDQFGRLDQILGHLEEIQPSKLKEKITSQRDSAVLSRELAVLDSMVPIEYSLEHLKMSEPNKPRLYELFRELEFKRLALEYSPAEEINSTISVESVNTSDQLKKLVTEILSAGRFSIHICEENKKTMALGCKNKISIIAAKDAPLIDEIITNSDVIKIVYDFKECLKTGILKSLKMNSEVFDVMLAGYLIDPSKARYDLGDLYWQYLHKSVPDLFDYTYKAFCLSELYEAMKQELESKKVLKLLKEIEVPLAYVLYRMESYGVSIDVNLLNKLSDEAQIKIIDLTKKMVKIAGEEINLNSPKQLAKVLFEKLGLPVIKKTKTGFSTNEEVLTVLADQHELPLLILNYRQLTKLKSTYLDALPKMVDENTNKIHTQFNQVQAETGRLSCVQPNLQNIPIRTEIGRAIRRGFIPSKKDYLMVSADYSQIELRILAHLSSDENLKKAFEKDEDVHQFTASLMFDVGLEEVSKEMRYSAKRVNFGIIYGMSAFGLAKDLRINQAKAQEFIDRYFTRYPGVKKFMEDEIAKCEQRGYVLTILKRRRYIPEINSKNNAIKQFAQRQAINTPVQGSAADLMKLAMINIQRELEQKKFESKMAITVHDELVFDVPKNEKSEIVDLIRDRMENSLTLSVPIKTTIRAGNNWLDMSEI